MNVSAAVPVTGCQAPHFSAFAHILIAPPSADQLWVLRNPEYTAHLSGTNPETRRALALLVESAVAREQVAKLTEDFHRTLNPHVARDAPLARHHLAVDVSQLRSDLAALTPEGREVENLPRDHLGVLLYAVGQAWQDNKIERAREAVETLVRPWAGAAFATLALRSASLFYQGVHTLGAQVFTQR
ncbi:MAG: hypothetical protein Q4P36_04455 [Bowdeniella nasicola]|nr:hypothetical protein [Bowdeniella nasicola]